MPEVNIDEVISLPGSERAILSIVLHNPDKLLECENNKLFADHFSVPGHQYIYSAICYLFANPDVNQIDSLAIYNVITDPVARTSVDNLGGMTYIDSLLSARVADNLLLYVNQVRTCALKRLAYKMGDDIKDVVLNNQDMGLDELFDVIQKKTLELVLANEDNAGVYQMGSSAEERLRQRAEHPEEIPGYTMGWKTYDKITQGFKGNELVVFVAESKTGKSTLLLNHANKFSVEDGVPGLYIDTEMTDEEQEDRLLAINSGVTYEEIYNGMFSKDTIYGLAADKIARLNASLEKIKQSKMFHIYLPNFTIEGVSTLIRKYKIQENIGYAIFDYIKLPTSEIAGLATAQEYQRLGFITTCLKDMAGICDIPILTAAQSNRSAIGNTNMDASTIGGSYRILQMATKLIFLRNKTDYEMGNEGFGQGNQKLKIAYQRNGSSGNDEINMQFDKPILRMKEITGR